MGAFNGMKKGVLASAIGATGTVVAVTGAYGLGMFESAEEQVDRPTLSGTYDDWWINKNGFRQQPPKDCIKKTFPGIKTGLEQLEGYEIYNDSNKDKLNAVPNINFSKDKSSNGCLTVVWERTELEQKTTENKDKYSGSFSLLWSFSQEDKGFITYSHISFYENGQNKAWASGWIYALEKYETDKWKITAQYEMGKDHNNVFPEPGETLSSIKDLDFWGLEGEVKKDKSNLVKGSDFGSESGGRKHTFGGSYWRWVGKKRGKSKITDWSSNLNDWWTKLFGDCKNKVLDKVGEITGEWEQVAIEWDKSLGSGGR